MKGADKSQSFRKNTWTSSSSSMLPRTNKSTAWANAVYIPLLLSQDFSLIWDDNSEREREWKLWWALSGSFRELLSENFQVSWANRKWSGVRMIPASHDSFLSLFSLAYRLEALIKHLLVNWFSHTQKKEILNSLKRYNMSITPWYSILLRFLIKLFRWREASAKESFRMKRHFRTCLVELITFHRICIYK